MATVCTSATWIQHRFSFPERRTRMRRNSFTIRNQMVEFKSTRAVSIPYRELGFPGEDYVKDVERIVRVAFPDSSRIDYLGNNSWRSRIKPVTFFNVSATPICYLRVFYKEAKKVLRLESDKLVLEFIGFPPGVDDINLKFSLAGDLASSTSNGVTLTNRFHGSVSLGLQCDLPLPLSLMPEAILLPVGDAVLDRILAAMESALLDGLVSDYRAWCRSKAQEKKKQQEQGRPNPPTGAEARPTFRAAPP